jgi:hypothetical protein
MQRAGRTIGEMRRAFAAPRAGKFGEGRGALCAGRVRRGEQSESQEQRQRAAQTRFAVAFAAAFAYIGPNNVLIAPGR